MPTSVKRSEATVGEKRRVAIMMDGPVTDRLDVIGAVTGRSLQSMGAEALEDGVARQLEDEQLRERARELLARQAAALERGH